MDNKAIRQRMRQQRQSLSARQQADAAHGLARQLCQLPAFLFGKNIAFYLTNDGEIDPFIAMGIAESAGKACHLPVLHPLKQNRLYFVRYRSGQPLVNNRFGIAEPSLRCHRIIPPYAIDVILLPMAAFDCKGNRLGMGGGFYDRTLGQAFKRTKFIGLAHSCQETDSIAPQPWDIPLQAIVTERDIIQIR